MEDVDGEWGYWLGRGDDVPEPSRELDAESVQRQPAPLRRRRYEELLRV